MYAQQVKRTLPPLVGLLKPQFGMIADQVAALNLVATRGGSEVTKIRMLREGGASTRQSVDIAIIRIKDQHIVVDDPKPSLPPRGGRKPLRGKVLHAGRTTAAALLSPSGA